ncbi:nitroreductase family protein [Neptunicella sp. SCSIO 80796]|uniref:nitroreductase family protein n=1 Tax=Neptunicella plasticusilytica TaxID=3117012 RepID=UPI003A4D8153
MSTITALRWRSSLKQFSSHKVASNIIQNLLEAARLSASSYGLQPYRVWVVDDPDLLAQLSEQAYGQTQVAQCSHLLVFANETVVNDRTVDRYFEYYYQQTQSQPGSLDGYASHIKSALASKTAGQAAIWAEQQAYIALGAVLTEAAVLGVDTCPMTGFDNKAINHTLGLDQHELNACVICAVGYRNDNTQAQVKVRTPSEQFARFVA